MPINQCFKKTFLLFSQARKVAIRLIWPVWPNFRAVITHTSLADRNPALGREVRSPLALPNANRPCKEADPHQGLFCGILNAESVISTREPMYCFDQCAHMLRLGELRYAVPKIEYVPGTGTIACQQLGNFCFDGLG